MILELNQCGQSEEMIQTGAAEDRSALGSPLSLEPQPYSIIDAVTGLRTFPCENCDKQFTDPSNLQRHIRSQHVGARSHACLECGKTFATSSGLKQHQHIHSSVKPFQCEVCLKAYTQFSNLCRHKRMHADCRQQIKCKDCGQAFSTMTSLSKHKRFCEGMLRPNGQQRVAYPGVPADGATVAKTPSGLGLLSASAQSPTSALASAYMNMYGPRAPFPFYPPFGAAAAAAAAGFPLFPGAHPMAAGGGHGHGHGHGHLGPLMTADGRLGGGIVGGIGGGRGVLPGGKPPGSPGVGSLHGQPGEPPLLLKRGEKNASDGSEGDNSSEVSSASDLDTSTGSDGDSNLELGSNRGGGRRRRRLELERSLLRAHLGTGSGGVQVVNSHTRLAKSPPTISVPPAAHHASTPRDVVRHSPAHREDLSDEGDDEGPFDLSKSSSPPPPLPPKLPTPTAVSFAASGGDQPLDLSVRTKDPVTTPKTTPRKTHIFGGSRTGSGSGSGTGSSRSSDGKRTPTLMAVPSSLPTFSSSSSSPDTPPYPVSSIVTSVGERGLHYAYPTMASPVVIEPMYRVDKEKPQSYQDVVARMMAFSPRLPMHHNPLGFPGLAASQHMGLLSPARPDAAKLLPPMLGKAPDHFSYNTSVNKLKERYACKFCGKVFPRSANLTRHLRTHTGEQPYKCKYCERSFSISSNLQRHVRNIHNKEKPFKCPLCDRCFGQQTNLDRHLKKHESDDPTMLDSPLPHEAELEEKDESYFDEIRNFIGKATAEGGTEVNGVRPEGSIIDANFSLTGQVVEKRTMDRPTSGEKRPAPPDDLDDDLDDLNDDLNDDLDRDEDLNDSSHNSSTPKKARMENNNINGETSSNSGDNGFHVESELDGEEEGTEEELSLNGLSDPQIKAPLACSS